jgi:hypothetical protein
MAEVCLRCGARMEWRHGTWQCPRCRFKVGCCEGATAECYEVASSSTQPRVRTSQNASPEYGP